MLYRVPRNADHLTSVDKGRQKHRHLRLQRLLIRLILNIGIHIFQIDHLIIEQPNTLILVAPLALCCQSKINSHDYQWVAHHICGQFQCPLYGSEV